MIVAIVKMLPAIAANALPTAISILPPHTPINRKIFGKNKTWKGLIAGISIAGLIGFLIGDMSLRVGYSLPLNIQVGILLGLGALLGDLTKSFFKRRKGISEGEAWPPFDQIDWVLGSLVVASFILSSIEIFLVLIILPVLHVTANLIWARRDSTNVNVCN